MISNAGCKKVLMHVVGIWSSLGVPEITINVWKEGDVFRCFNDGTGYGRSV